MRKMLNISIAAAMVMGIGSVSAQAADGGIDIMSNVKASGKVILRYENVDESTNIPNANALTSRTQLGVSADLLGTDWLSAYIEGTDVRSLNDNYDDSNNDNGDEANSVVADPEQTRLTQAYINMKFGDTSLKVGRQEINLDSQRFIGSVGWRQMFQTLDAYTLTNKSIKGLDLFASYVTQINRIFDKDDSDGSGDRDTKTLLLNAKYKVMDELTVTGYSYMIGEGTAGGGTDTHGISLTGTAKVSDTLNVNYRAEYAIQDDPTMENSGNPANETRDATYYNLELGMNMSGILAGAGYEVLSGDSDGAGSETAFVTPLATGHKFNGWADKFLATPTAGLEDMSIYAGYTSSKFGLLKVVYHDFSSEAGGTDYGTEIDAIYKRSIPGVKNLSGMLKFADYNADSAAPAGSLANDSTKFWAMLTYKFATK